MKINILHILFSYSTNGFLCKLYQNLRKNIHKNDLDDYSISYIKNNSSLVNAFITTIKLRLRISMILTVVFK